MLKFWLAIAIFLVVYAFIITEKYHRTVTVWVAAAVVIIAGLINQEQAIEHIDFNTLLLLIGMMIIVGITRKTGVFEFLAIKAAKQVKGEPVALLAALSLILAVSSALLDNVTAVLLIVPITFALTDRLNISPVPYLFAEILAANIGGTSTLIGDPPNIMIGSAAGLGFVDFIANLALPALIILIVTMVCLILIYRRELVAEPEKIKSIMTLNEVDFIVEWALLKKSLLVLCLTIIGFVFHQNLHLESATVALLGAGVLMLISGEEPEEALLTVGWPTIFFFGGLFILVGSLQVNGVLSFIAQHLIAITGTNVALMGTLVLWISAVSSAFVDNIPFVATMIPLLQEAGSLTQIPMESIWWSLALGACLGGNGTLIGASANVVVAGIAERKGAPIKFMDFLKIGIPLMLLSILLSNLYLYLAYWR
jgi:Na+/H+ antiporter NhaD/arsenite permease-like protein